MPTPTVSDHFVRAQVWVTARTLGGKVLVYQSRVWFKGVTSCQGEPGEGGLSLSSGCWGLGAAWRERGAWRPNPQPPGLPASPAGRSLPSRSQGTLRAADTPSLHLRTSPFPHTRHQLSCLRGRAQYQMLKPRGAPHLHTHLALPSATHPSCRGIRHGSNMAGRMSPRAPENVARGLAEVIDVPTCFCPLPCPSLCRGATP